MIQIIGLMIGTYILVRMCSFISRTGTYQETLFIRIISFLNIIFTVLLMGALLFTASPTK